MAGVIYGFNRATDNSEANSFVHHGVFTVAAAPTTGIHVGDIAYVSDGAGGSAILAFWDGSNWKRSDTGATITGA